MIIVLHSLIHSLIIIVASFFLRLIRLYDSHLDCSNNAGAMSWLLETYNSGICFEYLNGQSIESNSCECKGVFSAYKCV